MEKIAIKETVIKEIIINDNIKIIKDKTNYKIKFNHRAYSLINSLVKTKIIKGSSADYENNSITFKAETVKTLEQYKQQQHRNIGKKIIPVSAVSHMIQTLAMQLKYLINCESKTILGYNPKEIIVINDEKFAFLGSEFVADFDSEGTGLALISCPFSYKDFYFSPELLKISHLPSYVHYKTGYFSFGLIILYSILETEDFYINYLKHKELENIAELLNNHPIKNTRIYWLLSRCLAENPNDRSIIYI